MVKTGNFMLCIINLNFKILIKKLCLPQKGKNYLKKRRAVRKKDDDMVKRGGKPWDVG